MLCTKMTSKWITGLNVTHKIKLFQKKRKNRSNLQDLWLHRQWVPRLDTKVQPIKGKNGETASDKIYCSLLCEKVHIERMKRKTTEWS